MRRNDGVDDAVKLAVAALRGLLGLLLVRLARQILPDEGKPLAAEEGAVASEVKEDPTAPIRPPRT